MEKEIWVKKENGDREKFDLNKVKKAVKRSGLSVKEADIIVKKLLPRLHRGITTRRIYKIVFELIEERRPELSHKFNLKRALMDLGPAGYNFEVFVAKLLERDGYKTDIPPHLQGKCVTHEVDVVASKKGQRFMCECKFHNKAGIKSRIQEVLYTYARFLDLCEGAKMGVCKRFTKPWLISNTKFSEDAKQYAECMGFPLLGWRYPFRNGLENKIDKTKCYPITVINMNAKTKRKLFENGIYTVFDIPNNSKKLTTDAGLHRMVAEAIVQRAKEIR